MRQCAGVVLALGLLLAVGADAQQPAAPVPTLAWVLLPSGTRYEDVRLGKGPAVDATSHVRLLYRAWANGRLFDERMERPYEVPLGEKRLVRGLEDGLVGMRVGGRRRIYVPSYLAWGDKGLPPRIPPRADVVYDVLVAGSAPHARH